MDLNAVTGEWFDSHLKGIETAQRKTGIDYYVINASPGEEWRQAANWREASVPAARFYLHEGTLSRQPPTTPGAPASLGGEDARWFDGRYAPLARWWAGDMGETDRNSLTFTSGRLPRNSELIGTPVARLWIASVDPDLNVYAVIEDVEPNGRSTYVTDGRLRASWRSLAEPAWDNSDANWHRGLAQDLAALEEGVPAEMVFDFFPIAYTFKAGHRIRIALTTSIGEAYQQPPSANGIAPSGVLLADPQHPSAIDLPISSGR